MSLYEKENEPIINAAKEFEVYKNVFYAIIPIMTTKFIKNKTLNLNLSLLLPNNFESFKQLIQNVAFSTLSLELRLFIKCNNNDEKIKSSLCEQLLHFSISRKHLKNQ